MSGLNRGVPLPLVFLILAVAAGGMGLYAYQALSKPGETDEINESLADAKPTTTILNLISEDQDVLENSFLILDNNWDDRYLPMMIEVLPIVLPKVRTEMVDLMHEKTGVPGKLNHLQWRELIWNKPYNVFDDYANFKKVFYKNVTWRGADERFEEYFDVNRKATIRLDEVVHGGVKRDGIPPLKDPESCSADSLDAEDAGATIAPATAANKVSGSGKAFSPK